MMIKKLISKRQRSKDIKTQERLLEYLKDKKTLEKAAKGSMEKRNELIDRVNAKLKHA